MKTTVYHTYLLACVAIMTLVACSKDIEAPSLPAPESTAVAQGVTLDPNQLFGIWEGKTEVGTDNINHFVQQYRVEFQSIDDAEAIFSHWYVDAATTIRDSVCNMAYDYAFDGSTAELTPSASAKSRGAVKIKAVHTGGNQMVLYAVKANVTTAMCTLTRTGDPEPAVTAINRTLPQAGELVTLSGRNLQFVDHLYLPTADGWQTYTIPLSAFKVTESEAYATIGNLADYLVKNKKQTIVKLLNYQLDALHPAQPLDTFQFCIANMRLVPYGIPANKRE